MRLPISLREMDDTGWDKLFGAYVEVNHSHWRGPPAEIVKKILAEKGKYEFCVPAMNTWASKFVVLVDDEGFVDVSFVSNEELSEKMQERLEKMEEMFYRIVTSIKW